MIDFSKLYDNCVYSSIAHAIFVLKDPFFSAEQSWDGMNYSFLYGSTRGTISFDLVERIMAGAARDDKSKRRNRYPQFKAIELFKNAPENVKRLAEKEALEYLYDEVDGSTQPTATIAFWSVGGEIVIDEDIEEFRKNGGEYLFIISVGHEELRDYWQEQYDLSEEELSAVDLIYERFMVRGAIKLDEVSVIKQNRADAPSKRRGLFKKRQKEVSSGYEECIKSLEELGIVIE